MMQLRAALARQLAAALDGPGRRQRGLPPEIAGTSKSSESETSSDYPVRPVTPIHCARKLCRMCTSRQSSQNPAARSAKRRTRQLFRSGRLHCVRTSTSAQYHTTRRPHKCLEPDSDGLLREKPMEEKDDDFFMTTSAVADPQPTGSIEIWP